MLTSYVTMRQIAKLAYKSSAQLHHISQAIHLYLPTRAFINKKTPIEPILKNSSLGSKIAKYNQVLVSSFQLSVN